MQQTPQIPAFKPFKRYWIYIPVILGTTVVIWLFLCEFDMSVFFNFDFTFASIFFIILAFLLILMRDFALMWRFRLLSGNMISWKQSFAVNILAEFTSAITPTAVGGSTMVAFFLTKEGIEAGRSATIMLVSLLLDELFFVVICPLLVILIPVKDIFPPFTGMNLAGYIFIILYAIHLIWAVLLYTGIFIRPQLVQKILLLIFKLPFLKRWKPKIETITHNIIQASRDIGHCSFAFWFKAALLTAITWTVRFLVVNAIFLAFVPVYNHFTIFARQIIIWIFTAIIPTPGGSGMSEWMFKEYYSDIFTSGSIVLLVAVIWRIITCYFYLILGMTIIPNWLNEAFAKRKKRIFNK
ncbi:MAG: flippase-like domain-containing protein [Prevotellaceae bacterium]|jgi:uncharacterized protein (TIRG00374 family)|nr:flippase-like domain-containing protein [Prevotellaceae bacterium]